LQSGSIEKQLNGVGLIRMLVHYYRMSVTNGQ